MVRHARKPGPKSFLEASKPPKGMGFKARMVHRYVTEVKSDASREADRKGFRAAWKYGGKSLRKWGVPKPGEFDQKNANLNGVPLKMNGFHYFSIHNKRKRQKLKR